MKKTIALILFIPGLALAQSQQLKDFQTPPNAAKPRVWWHWMNGNITKEGIRKDLDWMKQVGIGGFQNFDANLFTPVVVPKKLVFMQPDWKDAFRFATEHADKNGLEMAIAGSPGWSVTGGPWVKPEDGMKKYVWTELKIEGGKPFAGKLPQPSGALSNFQNVEAFGEGLSGGFVGTKPDFYRDALVIAYRIPAKEKTLAELNPKVTSSGGEFDLKKLTDGDLSKSTPLPPKAIDEDIWIQYEFDSPQTFRALSVVGANHGPLEQFNGSPENRSLQVSDDGVNFREVTKIHGSAVPQTTVSFAPTKAKYFRFVYKTLASSAGFAAMMGGNAPPPRPEGVSVAEFVLYTTSRIDKAEDKAGFLPWTETTASYLPDNTDAIAADDIIDVTAKMSNDGTLNWTAPAGNWMIVRLGYSLTGRQNHPASPEATGLEVDKLDKDAVRRYINTYLDMYKDATGGMMGAKGLQFMVLDSYEAGHMNWTKTFPEEFRKRRGYDLIKWIPALTGRVVKSAEDTEKFLWDFRKTIGELIAENHYDVIGEELHKRGMKRYTESHEGKRIYLADGMDVKRNAEVPMAAMWTPGSLAGGANEEVRSEADIRESASVANIYGKPYVAAESMTAVQNAFSWHPEKLKRTADLEMASGLNRFVIHTSVHQPLDDKKPGFSLGPFGQYFTRQETWSGAGAKAWMDYLGRSCYLLQQGKNVADILYLYGENTNITWVSREKLPNIPAGFEFDYVNSSALINAIQAKNGQLVANSGNTYKVLMLDESTKAMTLTVLKKIKALVDSGAKVIGEKPEKSPSLSDNDSEFKKLANEIWSKPNITTFDKVNLKPDVIISGAKNKILYRHRQSADQDIYWLDNRSSESTNAEISFRISGKIPELWNPQTGKTERVSYKIVNGRTIIPLKFESWDAYFIIFKGSSAAKSYTKAATSDKLIKEIAGTWKVNFNGKTADFAKLSSWSENTDTDIKYFSGTVTYENTFNLSSVDKSGKYIIDLGDVKNIAEVIVNGKNVGTAWKKPFKLDISEAVKAGENSIQINVTNLWVNRLIGDAQPDAKKTTFTTMPFYRKDAKLLPSGLLTPVNLYLNK
ncbi:glycosyl hydrolase [Emticicia sp. BO119]|uniref:glycosyl hydrolase n=1 Tax=Emticicia sp. BO119 TaxID=2757768 RepID=UPI0015F10F0E|nr:glycosyl hydrolase [Emticicia sp. BO119]MBA4850163.1 discoidin domain-containing protein [Emticicia sp. BO119]